MRTLQLLMDPEFIIVFQDIWNFRWEWININSPFITESFKFVNQASAQCIGPVIAESSDMFCIQTNIINHALQSYESN